MFGRLAKAMGRPELANDPRYATHSARGAAMAELDNLIAAWTRRSRPRSCWTGCTGAASRPAGSSGPRTCSTDPHFAARAGDRQGAAPGLRRAADAERHPAALRHPGPGADRRPALGEHNDEIYGGLLGLTNDEIAAVHKPIGDLRPVTWRRDEFSTRRGCRRNVHRCAAGGSDSGSTWRAKTASTPRTNRSGCCAGIDKVCAEAGIAHTDIAQVLHGTTVGTNAILEGKGAIVGLVTTQGFRQVLQIARSFVPGGLAGWIIWPKPEPLAALENTIEVPERIGQ